MKRDTDQTTKQFPATPVEVEDAILAGLTKAMNSAAGRMDSNLTIGHNYTRGTGEAGRSFAPALSC